jgi:Mrp family chromosome partitioning ATPase
MLDVVHRLSNPVSTSSFTLGVCPVHGGSTAAKLAAAIAAAAAQASKHKILLIETCRREPLLAGMFGIPPVAAGLYEMLLPPPDNRFDTIYPTGTRNLFVLPAGGFGHRRDFMPSSQQVEWIHRVLSPHFPGIVMELPPMGELRAREFCHHVPNAVVLVAAPGRVGTWSVRRAVRRLQRADANLVGSVLGEL